MATKILLVLIFIALLLFLGLLLIFQKTQSLPLSQSGSLQFLVSPLPSSGSATAEKTIKVKLFFIALEDNGQNGKKIGCNDSVVAIEKNADLLKSPVETALIELFSYHEQYVGESGLYNSLAKSNLKIDKITVKNGVAQVKLWGSTSLGGVCDDPRFQAQIEETILQFPEITSTKVYLNDEPLF